MPEAEEWLPGEHEFPVMARQKGTTSLENQIRNRPWVHPLARRWSGRKRCQGQSNLRVHFMPPEGKPQDQERGERGKRKRRGVFPLDWSIQSPKPKPILRLRKVEVPSRGTLTYDLSGLGSKVWTCSQYERKPSSKIGRDRTVRFYKVTAIKLSGLKGSIL